MALFRLDIVLTQASREHTNRKWRNGHLEFLENMFISVFIFWQGTAAVVNYSRAEFWSRQVPANQCLNKSNYQSKVVLQP